MSCTTPQPRTLDLPREEDGLATADRAVERLRSLLPTFIEEQVERADADGLVVALDGGVESTVVAAVAADAVGPDRVTGLVMPVQLNDEASARDAEAAASILDIDCQRLQLQPLLTAFQDVIGTTGQPADDLVAIYNAGERLKQACQYYVANTTDRLVVGTVNRTDRLLGSMVKHGENGVDLLPLGDLYRAEVEALASGLEVPEEILDRPQQTIQHDESAAERLGIEPRTLDSLLRLGVDEGRDNATIADRLDVDRAVVERVMQWVADTRHKRHRPPTPSMDI